VQNYLVTNHRTRQSVMGGIALALESQWACGGRTAEQLQFWECLLAM
jgi:hypothetical protein